MPYFIVPITDNAVTTDDLDTAIDEAQYRAEVEGIPYLVVHDANPIEFLPPEDYAPEHVRNGVTPGVDFPATLGSRGVL